MAKKPVIKKKLLLIEEKLLDQITKLAKKEHRTVNAEIIDILENALPSKQVFVENVTKRRNAIYQKLDTKKKTKEPIISDISLNEDIMTEEEFDAFFNSP
ncbi:MAG: Arc family DNA-binding protein, partial [Candidatus Saccharibacteria bacterium]|nr:Arc family DNA-binding protein [Candidatus Saccharibacteria bacterium]